MKYSLEARCPILDKDVMEYSFRLPHSLNMTEGKKRILKSIAYDYIPREMLDRKKEGVRCRWINGCGDRCGRVWGRIPKRDFWDGREFLMRIM